MRVGLCCVALRWCELDELTTTRAIVLGHRTTRQDRTAQDSTGSIQHDIDNFGSISLIRIETQNLKRFSMQMRFQQLKSRAFQSSRIEKTDTVDLLAAMPAELAFHRHVMGCGCPDWGGFHGFVAAENPLMWSVNCWPAAEKHWLARAPLQTQGFGAHPRWSRHP